MRTKLRRNGERKRNTRRRTTIVKGPGLRKRKKKRKRKDQEKTKIPNKKLLIKYLLG